MDTPRQGPAPVTGVFPAGVDLRLLETGIQAIRLSPYRAGRPAGRPVRLGTTAGFLACYGPSFLTDPGKPSGPQTPPPVRARYAGYTTVRLVAHGAKLGANGGRLQAAHGDDQSS